MFCMMFFFFKDIICIMCILYFNGLIKMGVEILFVLFFVYFCWEKKNDIIVMYYM